MSVHVALGPGLRRDERDEERAIPLGITTYVSRASHAIHFPPRLAAAERFKRFARFDTVEPEKKPRTCWMRVRGDGSFRLV